MLPDEPYVGRAPVSNGERATVWRGLIFTPYTPGDRHHGPRVRPAQVDEIVVERDGRRGQRGTAHGIRRVLVFTGPPRVPGSISEILGARPPAASSVETRVVERGDLLAYQRLTRVGRNLDDVDRDTRPSFAVKRKPVTARCCDCGRHEPCPCDRR